MRNIISATCASGWCATSFSPDNFEEWPLLNKGDNLYKWRRKIVGFSSKLPYRNCWRQQLTMTFFGEYRRHECGKVFIYMTVRPSRLVLTATFPDKTLPACWMNSGFYGNANEWSKFADALLLPETSSFNIIL